MPYTSLKRLTVQSAGSNSGVWGAGGVAGDDLNTGVMGLLDTQLAGLVTNSVSSSNVSLTYANIQCCMFRFTGTLLANIVASPAVGDAATYFNGFYYFENLTSGTFTITLTTGAGSVVLPQGRRGCVFVDASNGPRIVSLVGSSTADPISAGYTMLFYNATAPPGWSAVVLNDYALKIVSSGNGGVTSGSVAYSTLFARTATDAHVLTTADTPAHYHFMAITASSSDALTDNSVASTGDLGNSNNYQLRGTSGTPTLGSTSISGSGGGHTHGLDMRVQTAAFTLGTRN